MNIKHWLNGNRKRKLITQRANSPSATLSTTNPTTLEMKPDLRSDKPQTKRLTHNTVILFHCSRAYR